MNSKIFDYLSELIPIENDPYGYKAEGLGDIYGFYTVDETLVTVEFADYDGREYTLFFDGTICQLLPFWVD